MATITGTENIARFLETAPDTPFNVVSGAPAMISDPRIYNIIASQAPAMSGGYGAPQQQVGNNGGLLFNIGKGIVDPFLRFGGAGAYGLLKLLGQDENAEQWKKDQWGEDANVAEQALKGAIGVGSWFVPGLGPAGSIGNLVSRGALAGGMGALSTQDFLTEGVDIKKVGTGALLGGGISGGIGLLGKGIRAASGKTLEQMDDAIRQTQDDLVRAGMKPKAASGMLGTGGKIGDLNSKMNWLSGADDITRGTPRLMAGQGVALKPSEQFRLAQDMIARYGDDIPSVGQGVLDDIIARGGDDAATAVQKGLTNQQIAKALGSTKGLTSIQGGELLKALGKSGADKLAYTADDLLQAGRAAGVADDVLDDFVGKLGGVSGQPQTGSLAQRVGKKLSESADDQLMGQLRRTLGKPPKSLGSMSLYDDAMKITTSQGKPLIQLGDTADDVLAKAQSILDDQGGVISQVTDDLASKGVTVDLQPINKQLQGQLAKAITPQQKAPIMKALATLNEATDDLSRATYGDDIVSQTLKLGKINNKVLDTALKQAGVPGNQAQLVLKIQEASTGSLDDVLNAMKFANLSDDVIDDVVGKLPNLGTNQKVPVNTFYKLKQEIGRLGRWNKFSPPSEQQTASAFNDLYGRMNDTLDDVLTKSGFDKFRAVNKNLSVAQKVANQAQGRVWSQSGYKPLGFGELVGGLGGAAMTGSPLGAIPGVALSKLQRAPQTQQLLIQAQKAIGDRLAGQAGSQVAGQAGGQFGNVFSGIGSRFGPLGKAPQAVQNLLRLPAIQKLVTGRMQTLLPQVAASVAGSQTGDLMLRQGDEPKAVLGASTIGGVAPTGGMDAQGAVGGMTGQPTGQIGGQMGFVQDPNTGQMMPAPGTGPSYFELFEAALADTGDWGTAMKVTEFLAPHLGVQAPAGMAGMGGGGGDMSEMSDSQISALSGLESLQTLRQTAGKFGTRLGAKVGVPMAQPQLFNTARKNLGDILARLRTGAAINEVEERLYLTEFMPSLFDTQENINYKLDMWERLLSRIVQGGGGQQMDPMMQQQQMMGSPMGQETAVFDGAYY